VRRGMIQASAVPGCDETEMIKLPRTIRLDASDSFVFERAAEPGEWAVSGSFVFCGCDEPAALGQKQRVALRSGLLGIDSLGWSTLAVVTEATEADRKNAVERLATHLLVHFGAPDLQTARHAAEEEIAFATSLCDHPLRTLLAVQRSIEDGEIRERFRTLKSLDSVQGADRLHRHAHAFTFHDVDDEEEVSEQIDLVGLTKKDRI
jgi:hypothetical protein